MREQAVGGEGWEGGGGGHETSKSVHVSALARWTFDFFSYASPSAHFLRGIDM